MMDDVATYLSLRVQIRQFWSYSQRTEHKIVVLTDEAIKPKPQNRKKWQVIMLIATDIQTMEKEANN